MSSPRSTAAPLPPECASCTADLDQLIAGGDMPVRFRAVAALPDGTVWGHVATVCGSPDGLLYEPRKLVAVAHRARRLEALANAFLHGAMRRYAEAVPQGMLVLSLLEWEDHCADLPLASLLGALLPRYGLSPKSVVLLHPGGGTTPAREKTSLKTLQALRGEGVRLASASLGCQRSEDQLWSHVPPDFVITQEHVLADIEPAALTRSRFAALLAAERAEGRQPVVTGIASLAMCRAVMELGIAYGAGDFIGRANLVPSTVLSAAASKLMLEHHGDEPRDRGVVRPLLERLLAPVSPVRPGDTAESVFARFEHDKGIRAIAVVRDDHPVGLISRYDMVENMARPYRQELYGRKACTRFMDPEPVLVDVRLSLQELSDAIVQAHPRHLISGFIVTDRGRYLGIGSVQDLMREVTAMQMEAARYASPLTELPGNVPINRHIDAQLAAGERCVIGYCDLDNFKPFNDVYGYARGDAVIRLTARLLAEACDSEVDFLGHIGGDDFIVVFRSRDWHERCERVLARFADEIRGFFSKDDLEQGGYVTDNRKGQPEFHAITSLSIGLVEAVPGMFASHLNIARVAAEVKKQAKAIPGNSLYVNRRTYPEDAGTAKP